MEDKSPPPGKFCKKCGKLMKSKIYEGSIKWECTCGAWE